MWLVPECRSLERDEALAELTKRYFVSHGPALLRDYACLSGLTMSDAKASIEMAGTLLNHETVEGKTYWFGELGRLLLVGGKNCRCDDATGWKRDEPRAKSQRHYD